MYYSPAYESDLTNYQGQIKKSKGQIGELSTQRQAILNNPADYGWSNETGGKYAIYNADQQAALSRLAAGISDQQALFDKSKKGIADSTGKYNSITSVFTPYLSPDYASKNSQAYLNFYQPQLIDQFGAAKKASMFQLANQGNLTGSASDSLFQGLQSLFSTSMNDINKRAEEYGAKSQSDVTRAVDSAYRQAPDVAGAKATAQTAAAPFADYSKVAPLSPLADAFSSFVSGRGVAANSFQSNAGNAFGGGGGAGGAAKPGLPGTPPSITEILQRNNAGSSQQKVVR